MTVLDNRSADWPRVITGGLPVDLVDEARALEVITHYADGHAAEALALASANLDHIHHFGDDGSWLSRSPASLVATGKSRRSGSLNWMTLLDGVPLARTARRMTGVPWPRLAGSDLIDPVLELASEHRWRVGFLGGTEQTHEALRTSMSVRWPGVPVSGYWAPKRELLFDPPSASRLAEQIAAVETTILVVGLGKPRQERWIEQYGARTGARVMLAFGAVVDFLAGRVTRAPRWIADSGMEWAWRLLKEPRRLARRYLIQGPPAYMRLRTNSHRLPGVPCSKSVSHPSSSAVAEASRRASFASDYEPVDVTAIIVTYNSERDIDGLLASLRNEASTSQIRVVVCDNGSTDRTLRLLGEHDDITVLDTGVNAGYAAAINRAMSYTPNSEAILILNPDVRVVPGCIVSMLQRLRTPGTGAVVPLMVDAEGVTYRSIRREPSVLGCVGDSLFGNHFPNRPMRLSETDRRTASYQGPRAIDWATGAAILVDREIASLVGRWDEDYFLYSEETDFLRRLREAGYALWFEPNAVVQHGGGGSGRSSDLYSLMTINKARYAEKHMDRTSASLFRYILLVGEALRTKDSSHRASAKYLLRRRSWDELVALIRGAEIRSATLRKGSGTIIIPAHNEASSIRRVLTALSSAAKAGDIEVIVVCNGCTDETAAVAREYRGVRVAEIQLASKVAALNEGDRLATRWPRMYLDANVECPIDAAFAVLHHLAGGTHLAGRPIARSDTEGASWVVCSYYRARNRMRIIDHSLWGAGCYALAQEGHSRVGSFPALTSDDLFVDSRFTSQEKIVVATSPVVVRTPRTAPALLAVLTRSVVRNREYFASTYRASGSIDETTSSTAIDLLQTVRGPQSAQDALVYACFALLAHGKRASMTADAS